MAFGRQLVGSAWEMTAFGEAEGDNKRNDARDPWCGSSIGSAARSLVEMMRTIDGLRVKDVHFRSLTEQFDSATAHGRFALQMHGAIAEYFLDLNRERTMEGLKAALAHRRKGGRPKKMNEDDIAVSRALLAASTISVAEIANRLGVSRDTFYCYFHCARANSMIFSNDKVN